MIDAVLVAVEIAYFRCGSLSRLTPIRRDYNNNNNMLNGNMYTSMNKNHNDNHGHMLNHQLLISKPINARLYHVMNMLPLTT